MKWPWQKKGFAASGPAIVGSTGGRHVSGAGTFNIHNGPGNLFSVNINSPATGGLITAYDSVSGSGNVIAVWAATVTGSFDYGNMPLGKGLTFVTTGTPDITVVMS